MFLLSNCSQSDGNCSHCRAEHGSDIFHHQKMSSHRPRRLWRRGNNSEVSAKLNKIAQLTYELFDKSE